MTFNKNFIYLKQLFLHKGLMRPITPDSCISKLFHKQFRKSTMGLPYDGLASYAQKEGESVDTSDPTKTGSISGFIGVLAWR